MKIEEAIWLCDMMEDNVDYIDLVYDTMEDYTDDEFQSALLSNLEGDKK